MKIKSNAESFLYYFWPSLTNPKYYRKLPFSILLLTFINPFSAGAALMLMQTGWIQASRRVIRRLAWDPTCLLLSPSFPIKNKQNFKVLKSRRQYNLFLENYPAFKGLDETMNFCIFGKKKIAQHASNQHWSAPILSPTFYLWVCQTVTL